MLAHIETQAYDIQSFCKAHSISRSFVYLEIKAGRLKPCKAGRRTLISREAAEAWLQTLEYSPHLPERVRAAGALIATHDARLLNQSDSTA